MRGDSRPGLACHLKISFKSTHVGDGTRGLQVEIAITGTSPLLPTSLRITAKSEKKNAFTVTIIVDEPTFREWQR
jgi:hypothetical protein